MDKPTKILVKSEIGKIVQIPATKIVPYVSPETKPESSLVVANLGESPRKTRCNGCIHCKMDARFYRYIKLSKGVVSEKGFGGFNWHCFDGSTLSNSLVY